MPRACAAIVMRVWSSVRSAILKPSPSAPTSREAGISQSSKYSSLVGEPLMPSLCSGAPNENPGSRLDFLGRGEQQRHRAELVHRRYQRRRRAGPGDFLDDDRRGDRVGTTAAVGLGDVHGLQVRLDQRLVHVPGELGGSVDLGGPRRDLVIGQGAHRLTQRLVLLGQGKRREIVAHASMVNRRPDRQFGEAWRVTAGPGR
jgi:hypothetical protein